MKIQSCIDAARGALGSLDRAACAGAFGSLSDALIDAGFVRCAETATEAHASWRQTEGDLPSADELREVSAAAIFLAAECVFSGRDR